MADNRYIRWIRDALASNPHLSQAGLARHLGKEPSSISHMLRGRRQLKADDIERIAVYLGSSPPGERLVVQAVAASTGSDLPVVSTDSKSVARPVTGVRVMGRVAQRQWLDGDFVPAGAETVSAAIDERYPFDIQRALEVDRLDARAWPELGDYVLVVPVQRRPQPEPKDFVIIERANGSLRNVFAAQYGWRDGTLVALDMDGRVVTDPPTWAVIGSHRSLIR